MAPRITNSQPSSQSSATAIALTIAGSDPSGGAGLQADLKTFAALGVYGCAVVTALTAQNTRGVSNAWSLPPGSVSGQIRSVLDDVPVRAIKLGMLFDARTIAEVAESLADYPSRPLICDPVMVATSGDRLLSEDAIATLVHELFPRAALITPNTAEAAALLRAEEARSEAQMADQAEALLALGPAAVLLKGGHLASARASDLLLWREGGQIHRDWLHAERIDTRNTHGTGCSLAAAIAAWLARGEALPEAVKRAKDYIWGAIAHADELHIGSGAGPVNHGWQLAPEARQ